MLGYLALVFSLLASIIVLGWLPLPIGHWPGISSALIGVVAGILGLRERYEPLVQRASAWTGIVLGALAALLGVAIYIGLGVGAELVS